MASAMDKMAVPERVAWTERRLRDGSILKYKLTVLQQPERARACGQGAKSHADRRPVDPPPVVELRLFKNDESNDVTFSYNSNFFLFASLENARPIAQGRVLNSTIQSNQPVLTGVPVSGMAYLDRPQPAGYFIFPDLSVRHEGKYRLHFALYEECKEEDDRAGIQNPEIVNFRVEVKSKPFTVYSAKKFPGLAESTVLSRTVAEQGCRVRIRRDVRMRRRSEKPGHDDDEITPEEAHQSRSHRGATPDARTHEKSQPHAPVPQQQQQQQQQPAVSSTVASDRRHRNTSDSISTPLLEHARANTTYQDRYSHPPAQTVATAYNHPYAHVAASPAVQPPQHWQQHLPQHHNEQSSSYTTPTDYRRDSTADHYLKRRESESNYYSGSQYSQHQHRSSVPATAERPYQTHYTSSQNQYPAPTYSQVLQNPAPTSSHRQSRENLPPLKLAALEPRLNNSGLNSPSTNTPSSGFMPSRSSTSSQAALPSPSTYGPSPAQSQASYGYHQSTPTSHHQAQEAWSSYNNGAQKIEVAPEAVPAPRRAGQKRDFNHSYKDTTRDRMQNGMRPTQGPTYGLDVSDEDEDEEIDFAKMRMSYRRADGVEIVRALPTESE